MEQDQENVGNATEATFSGFDLRHTEGQLAAWEAICRGELKQATWEDEASMDWIWTNQPRKVLAWRVSWVSERGRVDLSSLPPPPTSPEDTPQEALDWLVQAGDIDEAWAKVYLLSDIDKEKAMQQLHLDLIEGRKIYLSEAPWTDYHDWCCPCEMEPNYPRLHYITDGQVGEVVDSSFADDFARKFGYEHSRPLANVEDLEMVLEDERVLKAGSGFLFY